MHSHAQSTVILARIMGPMLAAVGLAIAMRPSVFIGVVDAFAADAAVPLLWGVLALILGLTVLAFHHRWDGVPEIVITVIGWASVVRGIVLLFVPEEAIGVARSILGAAPLGVMAIGVVAALIGAWLSYVGFRARTSA